MGETTKIEWTDATFNPWRGCSKVHTGCANCYAETQSKRNPSVLGLWGPNGTRVVAAEKTWGEPLKWDKAAAAAGVRRRVFCASLADVFESWIGYVSAPDGRVWTKPYLDSESEPDNWILQDVESMLRDPQGWRFVTMDDLRRRLFSLIDATPNLDWLLVTKRPENVRRMWPVKKDARPIFPGMPGPLGEPIPCVVSSAHRKNVWLLTSVSDQQTADAMIPELLECRDLAPVLGVSAEPLLGPVDLQSRGWFCPRCGGSGSFLGPFGESLIECDHENFPGASGPLDWVIVGGESGHGARPCNLAWIRSIVGQCEASGVACFVKQLGANPHYTNHQGDMHACGPFRDPKGGDWNEWPSDLMIREWPEVAG